MYTVLVSAPYMLPILDRFLPLFANSGIECLTVPVTEYLVEAELIKYAGQFDGTLCGDDQYTARVLEACAPRLKIISKWGTGIDSIDQQTCTRLGIMIGRTPNAFTLPVADSVLGYILAFARRQPWMDRAMKNGIWEKIPGHSLSERRIGVIGVGRIGKAVIRRAIAFGMDPLGYDIIEIDPDFIRELRVEMTSLEDLLERADFICLTCDLNPTSYHLINRGTLSMMKQTAVLINAARGRIIEENALIEALQDGKIAGAALDVFEAEPLPGNSPLLQLDNVMLAPHNANSSPEAWERVHWNTINNLLIGLGLTPIDISLR